MERTRSLLSAERGVTLMEVTVAAALSAILAAALITLVISVNGNVVRQEQRDNALRQARSTVSQLVIELRQALDIDGDGVVVESLDSSWETLDLQFYADRLTGDEGPELYHYRLAGCVDGLCDLVRDRYSADPGSSPNWTYTSDPVTQVMVSNVVADSPEPLVQGVSWESGSEVVVDLCGAGLACDFVMVRIRLRVEPDRLGEGIEPVQVAEDVRLRNA